MAEQRTRDSIWITALTLTRQGQAVTPDGVAEKTGASTRTVRETLNVMSDTPFLQRDLANDGTVRFLAGDGIVTV